MRQVQDFLRQISDDSTVHVGAVGEQLVWLGAQVSHQGLSVQQFF